MFKNLPKCRDCLDFSVFLWFVHLFFFLPVQISKQKHWEETMTTVLLLDNKAVFKNVISLQYLKRSFLDSVSYKKHPPPPPNVCFTTIWSVWITVLSLKHPCTLQRLCRFFTSLIFTWQVAQAPVLNFPLGSTSMAPEE